MSGENEARAREIDFLKYCVRCDSEIGYHPEHGQREWCWVCDEPRKPLPSRIVALLDALNVTITCECDDGNDTNTDCPCRIAALNEKDALIATADFARLLEAARDAVMRGVAGGALEQALKPFDERT